MSYEQIKTYLSDHKPQAQGLIALVIVFFIGVGVGKISNPPINYKATKNYSEYNTDIPAKTTKAEVPKEVVLDASTTTPTQTTTPEVTPSKTTPIQPIGNCIIKGNISAKDKIYHVKGGSFYDRVTPEMCFSTEAEAKAAGFRKSSR